MSSIKSIKILENKIIEIIEEMLTFSFMIPGSFKEVNRKCGKKNCWCQKDKKSGHPYNRITWSEKGKVKTKSVSEKDIKWLKKATENYRNFRRKRVEILKLNDQIKNIIDEYANEIIKATKKMKGY